MSSTAFRPFNNAHRPRSSASGVRGALFACLFLTSAVIIIKLKTTTVTHSNTCADPHNKPDGGDCGALGGPRRPIWACFSSMRAEIPVFLAQYDKLASRHDSDDLRIDHSFAVWYILRAERPSVVILSGACAPRTAQLARAALPRARIFAVCKQKPGWTAGVTPLQGDIADVNWSARGVRDALVVLADRQSAVRRVS
eukprot:IDg3569t1